MDTADGGMQGMQDVAEVDGEGEATPAGGAAAGEAELGPAGAALEGGNSPEAMQQEQQQQHAEAQVGTNAVVVVGELRPRHGRNVP